MDDLLLHLTGGVSVDYLVDRGARVRRGDLIARVMQGDKHLEIRSPLTGKVAGLNPSLVDDPNLLQDPYASWLCKIDPEHWKQESNAALLASEAMQWAETELTRFKDFLAERLAGEPSEVALQEGGVLVDEPLSHMTQELWVDFQQHFLEF
jgi:glycine cleavage system H lipoate-binding protein